MKVMQLEMRSDASSTAGLFILHISHFFLPLDVWEPTRVFNFFFLTSLSASLGALFLLVPLVVLPLGALVPCGRGMGLPPLDLASSCAALRDAPKSLGAFHIKALYPIPEARQSPVLLN